MTAKGSPEGQCSGQSEGELMLDLTRASPRPAPSWVSRWHRRSAPRRSPPADAYSDHSYGHHDRAAAYAFPPTSWLRRCPRTRRRRARRSTARGVALLVPARRSARTPSCSPPGRRSMPGADSTARNGVARTVGPFTRGVLDKASPAPDGGRDAGRGRGGRRRFAKGQRSGAVPAARRTAGEPASAASWSAASAR
jgi:hypothetical protein